MAKTETLQPLWEVNQEKREWVVETICLGILRVAESQNFCVPVGELPRIASMTVEVLRKEGAWLPLGFQEYGSGDNVDIHSREVGRAIHTLKQSGQVERHVFARKNNWQHGESYWVTGVGDLVYDRNKQYMDGLFKQGGTSIEKFERYAGEIIAAYAAGLRAAKR